MNTIKSLCLLLVIVVSSTLIAQEKTNQALTLPEISLIGNFVGQASDESKEFNVSEIEFNFQTYIYPGAKATVVSALHKEDGTHAFELEEAYVDISNIFHFMLPNAKAPFALGTLVGKKKIGFGKVNPLHPEQWDFVDRSAATNYFLGGTEGIYGEGIQFTGLLPLPFFSQLDVGVWTASASHEHEEHEGEEEEEEEEEDEHPKLYDENLTYLNRVFHARLWNSFELGKNAELEFGLNTLLGNINAKTQHEKQAVSAIDLTYTYELNPLQSIKVQTEIYTASYLLEEPNKANQTGGFIALTGDVTSKSQLGLRYSSIGSHGNTGYKHDGFAFSATRQLTDTAKLRLQYNASGFEADSVAFQFIFGMGPHAHVLQ